MSDDNPKLSDDDRAALLRWRLALGPGAERASEGALDLGALNTANAGAGGAGDDPLRVKELDEALSFVYEERAGGVTASRPYVPRWLASLRGLFRHEVVAMVQRDAIERRGLKELLFEPETLPLLEKNVELVATIVAAKGLVPDRAREIARQVVREVVEDVKRRLALDVRSAVLGAVRRDRSSVLAMSKNLDVRRTLRKNLEGWDRDKKRLVPNRLYFWANQRRRHEWEVVILVDQSASMTDSVVYSSIMAAIFASIDVLQTRLVLFDTEVVDMTHMLTDPVDVLFTAQLGGGTDINRAVAYAEERFFERPERTLLILVTDLFEGGNKDELVARLRRVTDGRSRAFVLLALSDAGAPAYDHELAGRIAEVGVPSFACTPSLLGSVMERVLTGRDPSGGARGEG